MTQEQENDLLILDILSLKKFYTKKELALSCIVFNVDAIIFLEKDSNKRYINIKYDTDLLFNSTDAIMPKMMQDKIQISISREGKSYLKYLENEKEIKELNKMQLKSVRDTNISVRRTNKIQIASSITTLIIIASALFIQYLDYNKEKIEMQPIKDSLKQVKYKVDLLENQFDSLYRSIDSLKN